MRHGTRHPAWQQNEVPEPVAAPHRWNTTRRPSTAQWRWRTRAAELYLALYFVPHVLHKDPALMRTLVDRYAYHSLRPPFRREGLTQTQPGPIILGGMTFSDGPAMRGK